MTETMKTIGFCELNPRELMYINGGDQDDYNWGYKYGQECHQAWNSFSSSVSNWWNSVTRTVSSWF